MFHRYESVGTDCSGKAQSGTKNFQVAVNHVWEKSYSLGIYNCRGNTGGAGLSVHAEGRAVDIGFPVVPDSFGFPKPTQRGQAPLGSEKERLALGLQYIIWDRKSYSRNYPNGRNYTGPNPHIDHLHIEQTWDYARNLSLSTAYQYVEEDEMTPEQEATLNELVQVRRNLIAKGSNFTAIEVAVELIRVWRKIDDLFDSSDL